MLNRPSVEEIAKNRDLNRYEVVVAVAKGARLATEEYIEVREAAERSISNHETDKSNIRIRSPLRWRSTVSFRATTPLKS